MARRLRLGKGRGVWPPQAVRQTLPSGLGTGFPTQCGGALKVGVLVRAVVNLRSSPVHLTSLPREGAMSRAFTLRLPGLLEGPQQRRVCLFQNPTQVSQEAEGRCRVTCISSLVRALWETFFSDVFSRTRRALTPALPPSPDQSHPLMPHQAQGGQSSSPQHLPHDGSAFSCSACSTAWGQRKGGQVQENWGSLGQRG